MAKKPNNEDEELESKKKKTSELDESQQMCRHGFHDWVAKEGMHYDEAAGEEVTVYKCSRCGKERLRKQ